MPELPEVETTVRGLRPLVGARVERAEELDPRLGLPKNALRGSMIRGVRRRGKYIVFQLSNGRSLVIHLRMSGRLAWECPPEERRYARLMLALDRGSLYFIDPRRLGTATIEDDGFPHDLGIEPFDRAFTADRLGEIVGSSRAPIKTAIMNQKRIAGIGNIYACEILAEARIDPRRPARSLTPEEVERLRAATVSVLQSAIDRMGTTLGGSVSDYRHTSGAYGSFQDRLRVYGREGEPCPRCETPVARIVQAGRSTYYCPGCQR
jgi:formamidopyrimidine-DNA glycosylase